MQNMYLVLCQYYMQIFDLLCEIYIFSTLKLLTRTMCYNLKADTDSCAIISKLILTQKTHIEWKDIVL